EVEPLDHRRRVARVEAGDRPAVDLAREEERRVLALHREGLRVVADEHDLPRARGDAERRGRERAEHIDDHEPPGRRARALEQARDAHLHSTVAVNGWRPVWKRSSERSRMSSVCATPSSISSTTSSAVAGECMNPCPLNPAAM